MRIAIMQPYLFPYIGYFQLMRAVDKFVVYDNIQFTKKGWINRNRILVNGQDEYFTVPLKKDSDYLNVDQRKLADSFAGERIKLLRRIAEAYRRAPEFARVFPLVEEVFNQQEENLFRFIYGSLLKVNAYLRIPTEIIVSSSIPIDHSLRSEDKVLAICTAMQATDYINPSGGVELYSKERFRENDIGLHFLIPRPVEYPQLNHVFVPWLSIIDVMMFNSSDRIQEYLESYYSLA